MTSVVRESARRRLLVTVAWLWLVALHSLVLGQAAGPALNGPAFSGPPGASTPPLAPEYRPPVNQNPAYGAALSQFGGSAPVAQPAATSQVGWQPVTSVPIPRESQFTSDPNFSIEPLPDPQTNGDADRKESSGMITRVLDEPVFPKLDPTPGVCTHPCFTGEEPWVGQILPNGLIYRSYLAGRREPRLALGILKQTDFGEVWEAVLGGRVGIFRYGTLNAIQPEGWQIDVEGASFSRLDPNTDSQDLVANDYRFGIPITYGRGRWQFKLAYWHLSAHVGDEFLIRNPTFQRVNYVRNEWLLGAAWLPTLNVRMYGEVGWAYHHSGGAEPWNTQFGIEYRPGYATGLAGAPFLAVNAHLLQDNNWNGNFVAQTGWAWRSGWGGQMFRLGFEYVNGTATQFEFEGVWEQQYGFAIWYEF